RRTRCSRQAPATRRSRPRSISRAPFVPIWCCPARPSMGHDSRMSRLAALATAVVTLLAGSGVSADPQAAAEQAEGERLRPHWAQVARYRDANRRLPPPGAARPRVVFLGDSITESWSLADLGLDQLEVLNRGIGGQTTPQMLVRFRQDVVALKPAVVHILAGTN